MNVFKREFGQLQGDGTYAPSNVRSGLIVSLELCWRAHWQIELAASGLFVSGVLFSTSFSSFRFHPPAPKWYQLMMGRFVTGFGVGACSLLVPMYQGESSPRHIRGAMVCNVENDRSSYQLFVTIGIFVAHCINYGTESIRNSASWRIPLGITFFWGLLLGVGIIFFPESPRYEYPHERIEEASKTTTKLYGVPLNHRVIIKDLAEMKEQLDAEMTSQGGWHAWVEMFQGSRMCYRIMLGVVLRALQQLTGANYFFYYGTVVFNGAGISNIYVTQMILGGVNFGTTFGDLYVIEHFGRRKSLIMGGIWMFVCFMMYASVDHFSLNVNEPSQTPGAGKAMVVFAGCIFAAVLIVYFFRSGGQGQNFGD
ncbi:hexose transporter hxt1 [Aspergillus wentii]|nr:hexose transporter hxt1 [Aspergillus wentii]